MKKNRSLGSLHSSPGKGFALAAAVLILAPGLQAKTIILKLVDDNNRAVDAVLFKLDSSMNKTRLGRTQNGQIPLSDPGKQGEQVDVKPDDNFVECKLECPLTSQVVKVTRVAVVNNLVENAFSYQNRSPATAALIFNELSVRIADTDASLAQQVQAKAYEQTALALNVPAHQALDKSGKEVAPSSVLQQALATFQGQNQIKPTGSANYETLSRMSGVSISRFIFSAPVQNSQGSGQVANENKPPQSAEDEQLRQALQSVVN